MLKTKQYILPSLSYGYKDLEPYISEQQLTIHHQKHHAAYVKGANAIFEKLENSRKDNSDLDMKAVLKELSFHLSGHILHSLFWENLTPINKGSREPVGQIAAMIKEEFGSFERFKKEFSQSAISIEGSGWSALVYDKKTEKPLIMQIEKHNLNVYPDCPILMVLDFWEHAYYLDYQNERVKFIEALWNIINWERVDERFKKLDTKYIL